MCVLLLVLPSVRTWSVLFITLYSTAIVLAGIVVTNTGEIYVSAPELHQIALLSGAGREFTMVAGNGTGGYRDGPASLAQFNNPTGLARDPSSGRIYIADQLNHCIRIYDPDTGSVSTLIAGLSYPHAVQYVDRHLFVLYGDLDRAQIGSLDAHGDLTVLVSNYSVGDGPIPTRRTNWFAVEPGRTALYVVQTDRNSIERIDMRTGAVTEIRSLLNSVNVDKIMFRPRGVVLAPDIALLYVYETDVAYEISPDRGSLRLLSGSGREQWESSPQIWMRAATYTSPTLYFIEHDTDRATGGDIFAIRRMVRT